MPKMTLQIYSLTRSLPSQFNHHIYVCLCHVGQFRESKCNPNHTIQRDDGVDEAIESILLLLQLLIENFYTRTNVNLKVLDSIMWSVYRVLNAMNWAGCT